MSSAEITILNNKSCTINIDSEGESLLYQELSFKQPGIEYSQAYKKGWNGIVRLFNKKKSSFNLGLIDHVYNFLIKNNYNVKVTDNREDLNFESLDILNKLNELSLVPREHQINATNLIPENSNGIIRAATGSGKTLITAMITAKLNKPTTIFVIGLDLLDQFHNLYSSIFDEKIGYIGNGVCDIQRINIASIWSVGSALNCKKITNDDEIKKIKDKNVKKDQILKMLKQSEVFILDECHVVTCDTIKEIYKVINPSVLLGMSGTPFRDDGTDLLAKSILGEKIIDIGASELIEKKLLVQPVIKFFDVPKKFIPGNPTYAESYKEYIVDNDVRNKLIVKQTQSLIDKGYTPLVLFKQIRHGDILAELFEEADINFQLLSGKDSLDFRNEVKENVQNGKTRVILSSTILDIGFDLPKLNALVLCGGGKSSIKTLQRVGRVIRTYPGKNIAAVVDFHDDCKYLKGHSQYRLKTYKKEKGFKVIKSKRMK